MSVVDEIAIKLGIQRGDLKAALLDSNAQIKAFGKEGQTHVEGLNGAIKETSKAMRGFRELLAAGGVIAAVRGFYEMAIAYAEKHTEDIDSQTEAVRAFSAELKNVGDVAGKASVQVLGFINEAGQGYGMVIGGIVYGFKEAAKAQAISAEAEQNILTISRARVDITKQIADIQTKIAAAEEKRALAEFDALSNQEKAARLVAGLNEQFEILRSTEEGSLIHEQTKLTIFNWQAMALKVATELQKEEAAAAKNTADEAVKSAEAKAKAEKDAADARAAAAAKEKLAVDALVAAEMAAREESVKIALAYDAATQSVYRTVDGVQVLIEKTDGFIAKWKDFQTSVSGSADYGSMSDAAIRGQIKKQQDLLNTVTSQGVLLRNASAVNDFGSWQSALLANDQIAQAQAVLNQRAGIRSTVTQFGTDAAVMQYGDSAVSRATAASSSDARNQTVILSGMAQTLNKVFPGQATPIPPITPNG